MSQQKTSVIRGGTGFAVPHLVKLFLTVVACYFLSAGLLSYHLNGAEWLIEKIQEFGQFFLLGLGGALVANSTGAGGGIVFIPAFSTLGLSSSEALSTSIMIQCFGMSAGALSWYVTFKSRKEVYHRYHVFLPHTVAVSASASIAGAWFFQYWLQVDISELMLTIFSMLSISFGSILLFSTYNTKKKYYPRSSLVRNDYLLIALVSFIGGIITSVISIGVGEILLILLFLRKFPMLISIFAAVAVSALTVIACAPYQIFIEQGVVWEIVAFAAPAAMIGGILGRYLAIFLGPMRIKIFCALWILITGILI